MRWLILINALLDISLLLHHIKMVRVKSKKEYATDVLFPLWLELNTTCSTSVAHFWVWCVLKKKIVILKLGKHLRASVHM